MDIILERYRTKLVGKGDAPATLIAYDKAARAFQRWLDATGRRIHDLREWDMYEFLEQLELAYSSKRTHMIHIKGALAYAAGDEMIPRNPASKIIMKMPQDKEPQVIPNDELRAMKKRITHDRPWLIFHLLAYTGMRQGEIRGLTWEHVNFAEASLRVVGKKKLRYVPIHPALTESLHEQRGEPHCHVVTTTCGKPVAYDTWMLDLKTFTTKYTAHAFRRTVATSLARNGVAEHIADKIMGWAPPTVGRRYYVNVATEETQRAILKLYANDPV